MASIQRIKKKSDKTRIRMEGSETMKDTKIIVFNDTARELTVRVNIKGTLPSIVKVEPLKRIVISMKTSEVFFKIWNGNVIMFQDNQAGDGRKHKARIREKREA